MTTPLVTLRDEVVRGLPRLSDYFGVWAIDEKHFDTSLAMLDRMDLSAHIMANAGFQSRDGRAPNAAQNSFTIGRIDLMGTLMKSESSMEESTSTVRARRVMRALADDSTIDGIIQVIDSPGGTVAGTQDYAAEVRRAAAIKPVVTFFEDLGASAAYWGGSPASKIVANESALIGSIGTLLVVHDMAKRAEDLGVKVYVLKRGDFKGTGVPGTSITKEQLDYYDGIVGSLDAIFKAEVSAARNISLSAINDLQARVLPADEALKAGLIDSIGNYDAAISTLVTLMTAKRTAKTTSSASAISNIQDSALTSVTTKGSLSMNLDDPVTLETLEAMCPGASAEFCMAQLKKKATIGDAMKAHAAALVEQRDAAVLSAKQTAAAPVPMPPKQTGVSLNTVKGTSAPGADDGEDFDALVRTYMRENPTKSRPEAVIATVRKYPAAHRAFLEAHPKNQMSPTKRKIADRAEVSAALSKGK